MSKALSGFMEVMSRLNNEINGAQPSEPTVGKDDTAPRVSAYAVSEVARMLGETAHVIEAWKVDAAWNAILAGDIDDLNEHVRRAFLGFGP